MKMSSLGRLSRVGRNLTKAAPRVLPTVPARNFTSSWLHLEGYVDVNDNPNDTYAEDQLKAALTKRGFDIKAFETKQYQQDLDIQEIDHQALPRPDSPLWGYLYGHELVDALVQLEQLTPDLEYKRNFLQTRATALEKKMKVHYTDLDYASQVKARLAEDKANQNRDTSLDSIHFEAMADAIAANPQGFLDLLNFNKITQRGAGPDADDEFGYYIPRSLDEKLSRFFKFEWDRNSPLSDKQGFVSLLDSFKGLITEKSGAFNKATGSTTTASITAFAQGLLDANTADSNRVLGEIVDFVGASPVVIGTDGFDGTEDAATIAEKAIALTGTDGAKVVAAFRGSAGTKTEAASFKGQDAKTIAAAIAGSVDADRIALVYKTLSFLSFIQKGDGAAVFLNGAFKNYPQFFYQFFTEPSAQEQFFADNGPAIDEAITALGNYNKALTGVGTALAGVVKAVNSSIPKDASGDAKGAVGGAATGAGAPEVPRFFLLEKVAKQDTTGDFVASLTQTVLPQFFAAQAAKSGTYQAFQAVTYPSRSGFSGTELQRVAEAAANDNSGFLSGLVQSTGASLGFGGDAQAAFQESAKNGAAKSSEALGNAAKQAAEAGAALDAAFSKIRLEYDTTFSSASL